MLIGKYHTKKYCTLALGIRLTDDDLSSSMKCSTVKERFSEWAPHEFSPSVRACECVCVCGCVGERERQWGCESV